MPVCPGVIVLGIKCERLGGEFEFARGVVKGEDDCPAVLPVFAEYEPRMTEP